MTSSLSEILECPICQERLIDPVRVNECMHAMCKKCIIDALSNSANVKCPVCNEFINPYKPWSHLINDNGLQTIIGLMDKTSDATLQANRTYALKNKSQVHEKVSMNERHIAMICVKVWRRRNKLSSELLKRFPIDSYFQVPETAPVSVLAHVIRTILGKGDDFEMIVSTRKRIRGVGEQVPLHMTFMEVAKKVKWNMQQPLEVYIEPASSDVKEVKIKCEPDTCSLPIEYPLQTTFDQSLDMKIEVESLSSRKDESEQAQVRRSGRKRRLPARYADSFISLLPSSPKETKSNIATKNPFMIDTDSMPNTQ